MILVIILRPFLGSALAGLTGRWLGARGRGIVTITGLFTRMVFSYFIFYEIMITGSPIVISLSSWFNAHTVAVDWLLSVDRLTRSMMVTVSTVSFCVHIYSLGYMQRDPHLPRFFSYLSLFTGSMLLLVRANDLVTLLVGWEMIGVCSYLLIGFWFHRLSRTKAAQKAMLVNRVSDTILLIGLFFCWWYLGSTDTTLIRAVRTSAEYSDLICLFLLGGALGKSAQVGLHVWLADAMEGPTPVSALIHAATLVTAGIFLIRRTNPLWELSVSSRSILRLVGAVTRLMRRSMGTVQNDVKRVIAYSTCSQLGYMMVRLSISHYGLAMYHLMTHACFKRLLFLGAGVVIHASLDVQDMRRAGGRHSALPLAWTVLLLGSLSLLGWPFLAGYYSKDAILELSLRSSGGLSAYGHLILMSVALLTSAYSFRVLLLVFYRPNNRKKNRLRMPGVPFSLTRPLCILAMLSIFRGYLLSDRAIGWGSDFWGNRIVNSPGTNRRIRSHMIPVWVSALPLLTVFLGLRAAAVFVYMGPLPFCAEKRPKSLYIFLRTRWGFDLVWNQQISLRVLSVGRRTWKSIDKGVLELLGPRGITTTVTSYIVPSVQKSSTGAVHDYALFLQILIAVGLILLALGGPQSSLFRLGDSFLTSIKTVSLLFLLYFISISIIYIYLLLFFLLFIYLCSYAVWRSGLPREAHDLKTIVRIYLLHMWLSVFCFCILGSLCLFSIPLKGLLFRVLVTPAIGRAILCILPGKDRKKTRLVALLFSLLTLLLTVRLWSGFNPSFTNRGYRPFSGLVSFMVGWSGFFTVSLEFGLDRLSLWMVLLTAFLMPLAILCSWTTMNRNRTSFYRLLLILTTFLFRCFTRTDLITFYVLYECALLPMFLLIGLGGSRARKVKRAYLLVLYTLFGSLAMLPLLLLLYSRTGTTNYELLRHFRLSPSREYILWWGFFLAFAVKVPLMPLHLWLPEAHVERSTAGSVLLRGVLLKLGTYRLLRFNLYLFPERSAYFYPFVSTVCLIGIIYASLTTLRQVDLKKIVRYSSVAHMSMVVLALFTMNEVGIIGSIFTMLAHGIRSPALFLCVGYLYDRTHTKALKYLGGCRTAMPLFSIWFFIFTLCNMAMPLTPSFVGEFLSLCGIFRRNSLSMMLSLIGVIRSAVYSLWAYARVVHGMPKRIYISGMADLNRREWWTLAMLFLLRVWFGIKPAYILDSLTSTVYFWNSILLSLYFFIFTSYFFLLCKKKNTIALFFILCIKEVNKCTMLFLFKSINIYKYFFIDLILYI